MTALEIRSLDGNIAHDIREMLADPRPVDRMVEGVLANAYRSEFDDRPVLVAEMGQAIVFACGPAIGRVEHLFRTGARIAARARYNRDDPAMLSIQDLAYEAGLAMARPPRPARPEMPPTPLTLQALMSLQIGWGIHGSLGEAKELAGRREGGIGRAFYGHRFTGQEPLPAEITHVQIAPRQEHGGLTIGNAAALPRLAVDAAWTLDTLAEVCQHGAAYIVHEMDGSDQEVAAILALLKPLGLIAATPQNPESLRAAFIAAGGEADPAKLFAFEHYRSRSWWDGTEFAFDPATGTLTVTPVLLG